MPETLLDDILLPEEAARTLKMDVHKLLKLAKRGEIPAKKVGRGDYRFKASMLKEWFENWQPNTYDPNKRAGEILKKLQSQKRKKRVVAI